MNASDPANGNHMTNAILKRMPMIKCAPTKELGICILAFTGAGLPCRKRKGDAPQEGWIIGASFGAKKGSAIHAIARSSRERQKVACSALKAEAATASDGLIEAQEIQRAHPHIIGAKPRIALALDAKSIHSPLESDCAKASADAIAEMEALKQGYLDEDYRHLAWINRYVFP